jgi:protein-disulfide isomerase
MKSNLIAMPALLCGLLAASALVAIGDNVSNSGTTPHETPYVSAPLMNLAFPEWEPSRPKICAPRPVLRYLLRLKNANEHHAPHARGYEQAELMQAGPLEEIALGSADSPTTIINYASMTCSHCAEFQKTILPELTEKYINTGKVRFILREFPLDGLAVVASMLVRCAGADRYYPMMENLFETQAKWALPGVDNKEELLLIAKQAGFSQEEFDQCLGDRELFNKITEVRQRAHDKFGVDSVPTFFVNGTRLIGEHPLKDFEAMLSGSERIASSGNE